MQEKLNYINKLVDDKISEFQSQLIFTKRNKRKFKKAINGYYLTVINQVISFLYHNNLIFYCEYKLQPIKFYLDKECLINFILKIKIIDDFYEYEEELIYNQRFNLLWNKNRQYFKCPNLSHVA